MHIWLGLITSLVALCTYANGRVAEEATVVCGKEITTYDVYMCLNKEGEEANRQLAIYYNAVDKSLARLDPSVRGYVNPDLSKDSFILYGGSMANVLSAQCYIQLTRERTHRVWKDYLAIPGAGEPSLPEPK